MRSALLFCYGATLRLLPRAFRRSYASEMAAVFAERLAATGRPLRMTVLEVGDVILAAIRLRFEHSSDARPALALAVVALLVLTVSLHERPHTQPAAVVLASDSIDFQATDPAGEFTVAIRRGRPVAATIDRVPLPLNRLVHTGDSIRFLGPRGGVVLSLAYYPERARIEWEPARNPAADRRQTA